jgi:hypothetical protein
MAFELRRTFDRPQEDIMGVLDEATAKKKAA